MSKKDVLQQKAGQGDARAQYELGLMYEKGDGVEKSYIEATKYYQLAAKQGDAPSLEALQRLADAFFFPSKNAQFALGELYFGGEGVARDEKKAVDYFLKAHTQYLKVRAQAPDYGHAQCRLGEMNEKGYGIPQNVPQAIGFYHAAIMAGEKRAKQHLVGLAESKNGEQAQLVLSQLNLEGDGAALERLIELARAGSGWLQYELGLIYEQGQGVKQNYQEAVQWYQMAMRHENKEAKLRLIGLANEKNHPEAQFVLASLYLDEEEVDRDYKASIEYLFRAAKQEHPLALKRLVVLAEEKEKNHLEAQFKLGLLYLEGEGVQKDEKEGVEYLYHAAKQKHEGAISLLTILADKEKNVYAQYKMGLLCNEGVIKVENMRPQEAAQEWLEPIAFPPKGMNVDAGLREQAQKVLDDIKGKEYAERFSNDIFPVLNEASKQSLILVMGVMGAGKSTLTNILLGQRLEYAKDAAGEILDRLQVADASKPNALMCDGSQLGTNIPTLFSFDQSDTMLCDLPGVFDTDLPGVSDTERDRQAEHRLHLALLSGRAKAIQAVLVVVEFYSLGRGGSFGIVLSELDEIIGDARAYEQCVFVVNMKEHCHRDFTQKEMVDMRLKDLKSVFKGNSASIKLLEHIKKTYLLWESVDQPNFREELLSRLEFEAPIPASSFRPVLQGKSKQPYLGYLDRYLSDVKERGLVFPEEPKENRDSAGNSSNSSNAGMMLQWLSDGRVDLADEVGAIPRTGPSS